LHAHSSYGNVHTAKRNTDNLPVAIKEIEIAKQNEKRIFNEVRLAPTRNQSHSHSHSYSLTNE